MFQKTFNNTNNKTSKTTTMNQLFSTSDLVTLIPSIVLILSFILLVTNKSKVIKVLSTVKTFLF